MKKRILILGSSSFSGATTVNYLLNKKRYKIFGTFRIRKRNSYLPFKFNKKSKDFKQYKVDLLKILTT